jgi:hypothetical protein
MGGGAYQSAPCDGTGAELSAASDETCTVFTCPIVEVSDASTDVQGTQLRYDEEVTWECDEHFETSITPRVYGGSYTARCDAPGSVTAAGTCIQVDCAINALDDATSAPVASLNHGETVTWTCNSGFKAADGSHQGIYTARCGDSGFALTAPEGCTQITCPVQNINSAAETPSSRQVNFGDSASWRCNRHFKNGTNGVHRGTFASAGSCGESGARLNSPGRCNRITCSVTTLDHATDPAASVNHGDDVIWLCAEGYKNGTGNSAVHRGTFTATCGDDGDSLTASDSCVQITCDAPPDDSYATVDANAVVLYGDRLTYTCIPGHVLSNAERGGFSTDTVNSITCNLNSAQNNGRYTPRPTVCTLGCVDGQYTNDVGDCLSCDDTCDFAGSEYESQTCAAMDNRRCASCSRGSYREVLDSNGFADGCVTCSTTCAQGQQIVGDCQRTGLTSDPLSCTSCAPGTFSASQTIGSDHLNPCVNCGAGYICPYRSGDTSATTKRPCSASDEFMAENDGTTCSSVLDGHYTVSQYGLSNTPDSVPHVGQVICEQGRRCPTSGVDKGRRFDCDASRGEFQSSRGATSCESVTSGWYTTPIDETLRTGQRQCERGYMCNPATGVRTKCGPNTFTSELGATTCRALTDTYFVVVKDNSVDQLRYAEVEAIAGRYVVSPTADSDGDRFIMPCGRGYQCPYRGDRTPCDNNVTFSEVLEGSACLPCYRCPSSETITAECTPTQDTVCNDTVPPVLESARQRITLEAVSDPVYGTFGESDPVTAYDDRSTADDLDARQLLTDRIHRSSNSSFITPPPSSCSYETERCSFVSPVNMTLVGTHLVTYTVRDNSDNSLTATRVVEVVDTTSPVITLNNLTEIDINVQEDPFAELLDDRYIQQATASDTLDDLLGRTLVPVVRHDDRDRLLEAIGVASNGTVWNATRMNAAERLRPEGWRLVYGGVIDWNGNPATDVNQTFILHDVSAPQITANNPSYEWNAVRNSNEPFAGFPVDYGATAIDFVYGDLSSTVTVQSDGGYTLAALGNYIITYHVADPAGNSATATAVVSVVDKLPPVITLRTGTCLEAWCNVVCTSASECDVNYGSTWSDPGVDVADTFATQDQLNVNVRGALVQTSVGAGFTFTAPTAALLATAVPLDTSAPLGTRFVLSYNVADPEQNMAVTRTRTVTIVDVSPPRFPQLDGNATIIDITSGDFYDEAASCPYAVDNFDGRIDAPCVYYNASIDTQRTNGTVYRQNFDYWNETRFRVLGEFNVTYFVVDTNGNTGTANRTFSVSSAIEASEATDGIGGGGIAGIVIVVLLMVVLVPVAVVAMQRRKLQQSKSGVTGPSNGMTEFKSPVFAEAAAMPPPPESWFHGDIDRTLAEERLRGAADSVDGVYLVRTRNSNSHSASYALSMLIDGRIIHYALSIPQDGQAPLLIQNVPTLHEWGTCLHDIIATLYHVQQGCTVTSGLRTPVPIPSSARDIASMYGPSTASEVYRKITLSPSLYTLSTAFEIERDGIFYRIFVPPDRVPVEVMLYTAKRSAAKEFEIVDRAAVDPWTPVYVRVTPEQLRGLVGATASDDDYDSFDPTKFAPSAVGGNRSRMAAPGEVIYDSNGQVASDQPLPPSGAMYTTVSKGTAFAIPQADDDHSVSFGNVATPADEGGVMYSSIVVTQPRSAGSTDFAGFEDFNESNDGDVVYSAVDHSNGAIDVDVMYSAVDHNNGATRIGVTANDGTDIIYSAVDHAPAVRGAIPAENGDVVYSAVAHDSAAPAPVMAGSGAMYAAVDKRGGNRGARPAALPKPSPPEWLHTVNRVEAEAILLEAGGSDGLYLVRPKDPGYAMSIILRGRFVHRLIEPKPNGQFVVDRQGGDWGTTLSDVVLHLENEMRQKHGLNSVRPVLAGTVDDDFDGFC